MRERDEIVCCIWRSLRHWCYTIRKDIRKTARTNRCICSTCLRPPCTHVRNDPFGCICSTSRDSGHSHVHGRHHRHGCNCGKRRQLINGKYGNVILISTILAMCMICEPYMINFVIIYVVCVVLTKLSLTFAAQRVFYAQHLSAIRCTL